MANDTETNVSPELWAEALAQYEADKAMEDRARGTTKRHQLAYESQGIPPIMVRRLFKESKLSDEERVDLYATEMTARRALDLWSAETPEDFDRLMERAAATVPASGEGFEKLAGARAYNDAFNGARHGKRTQDDNPHVAGTDLFVQWARGCADGIDYNEQLEAGTVPWEASAMEPAPEGTILERDEAAYRAGTQKKAARKKTAREERVEAAAAPGPVPAEGLFSDMPEVPGMPN